MPSDSSDALGAQLALSLALDGFDLQPSGDGQDDWRRSLPSRLPLSQAGSRQYAFVHGRSGVQMPVGTFGEPAVCDEGMLAAIEAVDWRLWAYASALHVCGDATLGKIVQSIVDAAKLADWERLKCGVLRKPEVDELARLFDHVHTRRLSMELLREKVLTSGIDVPMLPELVGEYAVLAQSVLSRLAAADPQELTRLVPPRLVDGGVDVMAWLHAERGASASSASWSMAWVPNERPLGTVVTERREGWRYVVLVSAGAAADCDRALLALPTFVAADTASPRSLANALHVFQTAVVRAFVADAKADVRPALEALRGVLADERAAAFHELVERWRSGDAAVGEWLQTLLADPRFRFVCHPGIDIESKSVVAASATDPYLDWVFDDHVPAGGDVAITFAMNPRRARRRMSRGRRVAGSPADLVDAVVACAGEHGPIADCAVAARRAQDLWVQFPNSAPHPIATAKRLLDGLLGADAASPEVRSEVFAAARRWIATLGHDVVPATWSPDGLVTPEDVGSQELAHEFHRDVPPGSVIVTGFGLRGPCGEPFEGALSAGPPPVGVGALQDAIAGLAALGSEWGAVSLRVADLAKHALANTQRLAASNLYDAFWEAAATTSPPEHQARIEAAKTALFEFVKAAGGMVPFEPSAVGDYPTGWIRESDGKQPRGRRIRRVVRPGLRTIDNALVRPALVITE